MKILAVSREIALSILVMIVLMCGLSGVSYGEDALTILDVQCEADGIPGTILSVTVKATIRANRDVENIRGWLTINGRIISLIPKEFGGGKSLGDLSAGQTKSFSITEPAAGQGIVGNERCGVYIEFRAVNPPPQTDPTPAQPPEEPSGDQQPNQPEQPQETLGGGTPTLSVSTTNPLTEATLHNSVVTLTLSGGTYARSVFDIRDAVTVSGITGVTIPWHDPDRKSDTQITIALEFSGNISTNTDLTFTVRADAIADYNGPPLTAKVPVTAIQESLTASTASPLTEATLNGSVVTLTLDGRSYHRYKYDDEGVVSVSGITGVTIPWHDPDRKSDTQITIALEFSGNISTNADLTFTVRADAIADYNGPPLTAKIPVRAIQESLTASTASPLTEATLNGSIVTLTLDGRPYDRYKYDDKGVVSVSGITGVSIASWGVRRVSDTEITVKLEFAGNIDTDSTLTFTVGADAITNYDGSALTAKIPVSASREWVVASSAVPLTAATLDGSVVTLTLSGQVYGPSYDIRDEVSVSGIAGVSIASWGVDRISDVEIGVELEYDGNRPPRGTLTFTIQADAIANYTGPVLRASLSVPTQLERDENRDVNGDGVVSIQDLILVALSFGKTGDHPSDVNGDGSVDIKDLILIAGVLDAGAAAPSLYPESLEILTPADLQLYLFQAHHLALKDATSQRGIRFLEQLLTVLTPKETALLANYPNPFNPETWIPYQLAKPADVTLTIYGIDGQVVRQLALGHQPAGVYQNRSRAAYWDGRNAVGEPVASGVYFYTLTAGDFTATRKMLIRK